MAEGQGLFTPHFPHLTSLRDLLPLTTHLLPLKIENVKHEGGVAGLAVASGAAAITYALQNIAQAGDHIVAANSLYGGSYNLITHTFTFTFYLKLCLISFSRSSPTSRPMLRRMVVSRTDISVHCSGVKRPKMVEAG